MHLNSGGKLMVPSQQLGERFSYSHAYKEWWRVEWSTAFSTTRNLQPMSPLIKSLKPPRKDSDTARNTHGSSNLIEKNKSSAPIILKLKPHATICSPKHDSASKKNDSKSADKEQQKVDDDLRPAVITRPIHCLEGSSESRPINHEGPILDDAPYLVPKKRRPGEGFHNRSASNEEEVDSDRCWKKIKDGQKESIPNDLLGINDLPLDDIPCLLPDEGFSSINIDSENLHLFDLASGDVGIDLNTREKPCDTNHISEVNRFPSLEESKLCGDSIMADYHRNVAIMLWEGLRKRIIQTQPSKAPPLAKECYKVLDKLHKVYGFDIAYLKEELQRYFQIVKTLLDTESSLALSMPADAHSQKLEKISKDLEALLNHQKEFVGQKLSAKDELAHIEEEMTKLRSRKEAVESSMKVFEQKELEDEDKISDLRAEKLKLDTTPVRSEQDELSLSSLEKLLSDQLDTLKHLQWKL